MDRGAFNKVKDLLKPSDHWSEYYVCGTYDGSDFPKDNIRRIRTMTAATLRGSLRTAFKQEDGQVYFAATFADENKATDFRGTLVKDPGIQVLDLF